MKKTITTCLLLLLFLTFTPYNAFAQKPLDIVAERHVTVDSIHAPKSALVIEPITGQILYAYEADMQLPLASITKLMPVYLAYKAIDDGVINKDSTVTVDEKFYNISHLPLLSNNDFKLGATYTVDELLQLIATPSSNAATYMLSSLIESNDSNFVDLMNTTAQKLNMTHTKYYNAAGPSNSLLLNYAPKKYRAHEENIGSARDVMILSRQMINHYSDVLNYSKKSKVIVKPGTPYEESFHSHISVLKDQPNELYGADGLKTGSSDTAGYNVSLTAKQHNTRLIAVTMGVGPWGNREAEINRDIITKALLENAFSQYEYKKIISKGRHTINNEDIYVFEDLYDVINKDESINWGMKNGKLYNDYERTYISSSHMPAVQYVSYEKHLDAQLINIAAKSINYLFKQFKN